MLWATPTTKNTRRGGFVILVKGRLRKNISVMSSCIFHNDGGVEVKLVDPSFFPNHHTNKTELFRTRDEHEVHLRRVSAFLIRGGFVKGNIVDLGAWIGDNAIVWALMRPESIIYAIDPSDENCEFIDEMAKINQVGNVKTIKRAISDKEENLSTHDDLTHAMFMANDAGKNKLTATTLDALLEQGAIKDVAFMHLDVEGMEIKVLLGAQELLKQRPIIAFEQHIFSDNYMNIVCFLREKNYRIFLIDEALKGCRVDCVNFISFPAEKFNNSFSALIENSIKSDIITNLLIELIL